MPEGPMLKVGSLALGLQIRLKLYQKRLKVPAPWSLAFSKAKLNTLASLTMPEEGPMLKVPAPWPWAFS